MILINYLLGHQTFSTPFSLSLTALLLLCKIHIASTMDTKRHSTFFLLQTPVNFHQLLSSSKRFTFWPKYQPVGHGIHICKFPRITPITSSSDDLPAPTIPTSAFYLPPSSQIVNNSNSASNLQPLIRSLLSLSSPSLLSVKAAIWSWWRHSSRSNKPPSPSHHYNLLQRKIRDHKSLQCILPRPSWEWLLSHFPSVSSSYPIVHDTFVSVPIILLSRLLTQYDILFSSTDRPISRSQFSTPPTHTWHKCRNAAPKIARHTGIIRSATGDVCKTTADLDRALRATRSFWQEYPCPYDPSWSSLIQDYAASSTPFSLCHPPTYDDFYYAIVTSPDSAPGADGIPYLGDGSITKNVHKPLSYTEKKFPRPYRISTAITVFHGQMCVFTFFTVSQWCFHDFHDFHVFTVSRVFTSFTSVKHIAFQSCNIPKTKKYLEPVERGRRPGPRHLSPIYI